MSLRAELRNLAPELVFLFVIPVVLPFWGQNTPVMTGIILALLVPRLWLLYQRGDALVLLAGVLFGGGNDLASMMVGVYHYTPPHILPWPIPFWMLLFWGYVFVFLRRIFDTQWVRGTHDLSPGPLRWRLAKDVGLLILLKVPVYLWASSHGWWTLYGALFLVLIRFLVSRPTQSERRIILLAVTAGPIYEVLLVAGGLYVYHDGILGGLPPWLLCFWVLSMPALNSLFRLLDLRIRGQNLLNANDVVFDSASG